jgi:hypothetical protein
VALLPNGGGDIAKLPPYTRNCLNSIGIIKSFSTLKILENIAFMKLHINNNI